jgi:hypothetical protein
LLSIIMARKNNPDDRLPSKLYRSTLTLSEDESLTGQAFPLYEEFLSSPDNDATPSTTPHRLTRSQTRAAKKADTSRHKSKSPHRPRRERSPRSHSADNVHTSPFGSGSHKLLPPLIPRPPRRELAFRPITPEHSGPPPPNPSHPIHIPSPQSSSKSTKSEITCHPKHHTDPALLTELARVERLWQDERFGRQAIQLELDNYVSTIDDLETDRL